jgi:hypothetical protein
MVEVHLSAVGKIERKTVEEIGCQLNVGIYYISFHFIEIQFCIGSMTF